MNVLKNYYKILKLEKSATVTQIKKAYFKLAKKYHPDHNKIEESIEMFREINEAYQVLTTNRKEYDNTSPHFKKGLDIEITVIADSLKKTIKYDALLNCKKCDATGFDVTKDFTNCKSCNGKGYDDIDGHECKKCLGTGKAYDSSCKTCKGQKQILVKQTIDVVFEVGKNQIILPFHGNQSKKSNHNGNLIINVQWPN